MIILASGNSSRIVLIASIPPSSGICRSNNVTSSRYFRNWSIASTPVEASATNSSRSNPAVFQKPHPTPFSDVHEEWRMSRTVYLVSREGHGLVGKMKARKRTASNSRRPSLRATCILEYIGCAQPIRLGALAFTSVTPSDSWPSRAALT